MRGLAIRDDGAILAIGSSIDYSEYINPSGYEQSVIIGCYSPSGLPDSSFDGDGKVVEEQVALGNMNCVAVQGDGKLVVAGTKSSTRTSSDFAVLRYNTDGTHDGGSGDSTPNDHFGTSGMVVTGFDGIGRVELRQLIAQPDGKMVGVGSAIGGNSWPILMRFDRNGSLDGDFGDTGIVLPDILNGRFHGIAVQGDGRLIAVGGSTSGGFLVARFSLDGTPDLSFNGTGTVNTPVYAGAEAYAVTMQGDQIVVAGNAGGGAGFAIARYTSDGSLDGSFDGDGKLVTECQAYPTEVGISNDRIVVAGGRVYNGESSAYYVTRYLSNGAPDPSFSGDGIATAGWGARVWLNDMVVQPDGKIVLAGINDALASDNFSLCRFAADGTLDTGFNARAIADLGGSETAVSLAQQADGKLVVAGTTTAGSVPENLALARFSAEGTLDTSFGSLGRVITDLNARDFVSATTIQPDGRIVVAGGVVDGPRQSLAMTRYFAADAGDTATGTNVPVQPQVIGSTEPAPIVVTFTSISAPGETTVETRPTTDTPPPGGFSLAGGTIYYDLSTTATFAGPVEVCFAYDEAQVGNELTLTLNHYENEQWVDVTSRRDTENNLIYGSVSSLSPFAIFQSVQIVQISVDRNALNLMSNGVIPVTLYTTPEFDAASVNVASMRFADAAPTHSALEDVDHDGDLDLLLKFNVQDTNLAAVYEQLLSEDVNADGVLDSTHREATIVLSGDTISQSLFQGQDTVDVFLSGKSLRELLDSLAVAGWI
jgi:uncharacterized delta-60 repeat protein